MKQIRYYGKDTMDFHDSVIRHKHEHPTDPGYKQRIQDLRTISEKRFKVYDEKFVNDKLEELEESEEAHRNKADFQSLYKYDVEPFVSLNIELSKDENGRKYPYCPLCDMEGTSSFDHILPQSKFPEFSDHPFNLIRSCQKCNGKKSSNWKENNKRRYIDLYIDEIPDIQFLFATVEISASGTSLAVTFMVENRNGIEPDLFRKINNHFTDLDICNRYDEGACEVISSLQDDVVSNLFLGVRKDDIKDGILSKCMREQKRHGVNYWRAILKKECAENDEILDFIIQKSQAGEDI